MQPSKHEPTPSRSPSVAPSVALVDVVRMHPGLILDVPYSRADNAFGFQVYPIERCLLVEPVARKVVAAQRWLDAHAPGNRIVLKDGYRPDHVQHQLWDRVKGTPMAPYVADPNTGVGSIHSYGAAVDVTLADDAGRELDMGTEYDHFGPLAEPRHEARFLREGQLTPAQIDNRRLLRDAMHGAGMRVRDDEWWHFDDGTPEEVMRRYVRLDLPLTAIG